MNKMTENKNEKQPGKKTIYDGIKLTEKGANIIVIALSALLILFLIIGVISG